MKVQNGFGIVLGVVVLALALVGTAAVPGAVLAGASGLMLMLGSGLTLGTMPAGQTPAAVVAVIAPTPAVRVVELSAGGVVIFTTVEGKLCSRFYRG